MLDMNLRIDFPIRKKADLFADLKRLLFSKSLGDPDQILFSVLKTDVGQNVNSLFQSLSKRENMILEDHQLFNRFMKRHTSMNYDALLGQNDTADTFFTRKKKGNDKIVGRESKPNVKIQAHPAQICQNFGVIMHKVISPELYGNGRNKKKILKSLFRLLRTARSESFNLVSLVEQINIDSITWITFQNNELKLIFIAKFLKWLFRFFLLLIMKYYIIAYIKEERIFLFMKEGSKEIKKCVISKKRKGVLEECGNDADVDSVKISMYMMPKSNGFRCIARANKYTLTEKENLRQVLAVLTFLYNQHMKTYSSCFEKAYIDTVRESKTKKFYVTSTDIRDAFESIMQDKLLDILTCLFEYLPEFIQLSEFSKIGGKMYKYGYPNFVRGKSGKRVTIVKSRLFAILESVIFNTKLKMRGKVYVLCKGVAQGLILSAKLCDIYYESMYREKFSDFRNSGRIYTHTDDLIYFTSDENLAKRFLDIVNRGIPAYNCWFNQCKLTSNVDSNSHAVDKKLKFLQWSIDSQSLELEPIFKSAARYSMMYSESRNTKINLAFKLRNLEAIKLKKLVLYTEINSKPTILRNISMIANFQAKRCFAIACSLDKVQDMSFDLIRITNNKLVKSIKKATRWSQTEYEQVKKEIHYIFWKAYFKIFAKNKRFSDLSKKFKKMIGKYNPQKIYINRIKPLHKINKRAKFA